MGKALYRKYRPKSLDTVVGQEHITSTLSNALKHNSISHAYLLTGPRGVGKTSVARILAYEINKIAYDEEATHLDIIEIDAASNRRIDEIRDLRDKVNIMPSSAKYKVYIIDEVHMLTREAFNALLKTLEEPPEHVIFILATTEIHKVPETIISRTQRYSFKPVSKETVVEHLDSVAKSEKIKITKDALELIADHGKGSLRDSLSMLDQVSSISEKQITKEKISNLLGIPNSDILTEIITACSQNDSSKIFENIQSLREQGSNPATVAQTLIKILREGLINKTVSLDAPRSIEVMKQLLPLTGANSSFEALEIAFLDVLEFSAETKTTTVNLDSAKESTVKVVEAPKENTLEIEEQEAVIVIEVDETENDSISEPSINNANADAPTGSSWNDVLNTLKSTHNTLYGVLRMAETKVEDDKIILVFQFEFHKKQLEQSKNMTVLKSIVGTHLGSNYEIQSEVKKRNKSQSKAPDKLVPDETLNSVSNIFGGAELLES